MPSRRWMIGILLFWLAMVGCLIQHDILPLLYANEPALFIVTLVDEPRVSLVRRGWRSRPNIEVTWAISKNGDPSTSVPNGSTSIRYHYRDDALEYEGVFRLPAKDKTTSQVRVESTCRVSWEGELQGLTAKVETRGPPPEDELEVAAELSAAARGRLLFPHWTFGSQFRHDEPVALAARGSVLILTQPLNRITGLQPGQRWRLPCVNLLAAVGPEPVGVFRQAEAVVSEDCLTRRVRGSVPCFVIDYHGDDVSRPRTWVYQSDGLVVRQEFTYAGDRIILEREDRDR